MILTFGDRLPLLLPQHLRETQRYHHVLKPIRLSPSPKARQGSQPLEIFGIFGKAQEVLLLKNMLPVLAV